MNQHFDFQAALRRMLRRAWMYFLFSAGLLRWAEWRLARRDAVVVLTFHRVVSDADFERTSSPAGMLVTRNTFEKLLQYVASRFQTISLGNGSSNQKGASKRLRLALTFDDGWRDNFVEAVPIARRYSVPLTIFICPGLIGRELPFWPERVTELWRAAVNRRVTAQVVQLSASVRARCSGKGGPHGAETIESVIALLKMLPPADRDQIISRIEQLTGASNDATASPGVDSTMNWAQIFELAATKQVTFGSHTQSHEILPHIPLEHARREIHDSKRAIEERLGSGCPLFAYPNGDASPQVRELVDEAGYQRAFINRAGAWYDDTDLLLIPRVNIWQGSVVGTSRRFSPVAFRYAAIWKAYRAAN
jgi:peptidoglycan/xylan/chitin deacetylase (PgdA/CDA1 family)